MLVSRMNVIPVLMSMMMNMMSMVPAMMHMMNLFKIWYVHIPNKRHGCLSECQSVVLLEIGTVGDWCCQRLALRADACKALRSRVGLCAPYLGRPLHGPIIRRGSGSAWHHCAAAAGKGVAY